MADWAQWRADLAALGGWENELVSVPAGAVRKMIEAGEALQARLAALEKGLQWYADGNHAVGLDGWDDVSGEPRNWLHPPVDEHGDAACMVEDGTLARMVLAGEPVDWDADG